MALELELEDAEPIASSSGSATASPDVEMTDRGSSAPTSAGLDLELEGGYGFHDKLASRPAAPEFSVSALDLGQKSRSGPLSGHSFDGKRVSFKRKPARRARDLRAAESESKALSELAMSMLEKPMHRMMDAINAEADAEPVPPEELPQPKIDVKGKGKAGVGESMWADRYRPRLYTDLLGDDRIHRSAMSWLKEWDSCVFKTSLGGAALARKKTMAKKRTWNGDAKEDGVEDPYGRPTEKVLLLSGPPGLGKTTLAHVVAKQAGYQVLEINASDDRSAKVVHERIQAALESRAIMSNGKTANKPTCVIIDEIDGATGGGDSGFIKTLVRLIQDGSSLRKPKGKKKEHRPLLRPIICVCNDLYAPALRPLRPLARIIRFAPPTNTMVVRRLTDICNREHLGADAKSLTMLVDVAKGDMRSCLNTLQFIKSKAESVDESAMRKTVASLKDTGTSPATVWERLFKTYYNRKGAKKDGDDGTYVARLARDVQTCGEYEKLVQGCFENYLSIKQPKEGWKAVLEMLEWLHFYDSLDGRMKSEHTYDLLAYTPYSFVPWHEKYAHLGYKAFEWPKVDYEAYVQRQAHQEIADTLFKASASSLGRHFNAVDVPIELAPFLVRILSPDLRPVNAQLVKSEERAIVAKLVRIMSGSGLTYVHERAEDGQLSYRMEPALDVFIHYDGKRAADVPLGRYSLRSIVAKELEQEELRKTEGAEAASATTAQDYLTAYKQAARGQAAEDAKEAPTAVDFFGRTIAAPAQVAGKEGSADLEERPRKRVCVTYKHHEGFSNAVRLNLKIKQLFRT